MEIYSFGVKSYKIGAIDPVTGLGTNMVSIGNIFQDTANWEEADPELIKLYAEQTITPVKVLMVPGEEMITLELMSSAADDLQKFLGGTVTTLDGKKTWSKDDNNTTIKEWFHEIECLDGTVINVYRGATFGARKWNLRRKEIRTLKISILPLVPKVAGLSSVTSTDPVE